MAVVRYAWISERTNEHGIESPEHVVPIRGESLVRLQVMVGAPGQVLDIKGSAEPLPDGSQHLHRFRGNFLPDSVAWDDGYTHKTASSYQLPATSFQLSAIQVSQKPSPFPFHR